MSTEGTMTSIRGLLRVVSAASLAAIVAFVVAPSPSAAAGGAQKPESQSAALVLELTRLMDTMQLTNVAAQSEDGYAAALYIPGSQLLIVSGTFASTERINYLLDKKAYSDAYVDMNGSSDRASRVLISDLGADGLRFDREKDAPFDYVDIAGKSISFNGEWGRKADISKDEYAAAYERTDAHYTKILRAFIAALKKSS
jgi:hypothetical protein